MPVLRSYARTDVGHKRKHNEDSFLNDDALGLFIVADGMGGHAAGEVASAQAVKALPRAPVPGKPVLDPFAPPPPRGSRVDLTPLALAPPRSGEHTPEIPT